MMVLDLKPSVLRRSRKLWPLPIFVVPACLVFCFIAGDLFGSLQLEVVFTLFLAEFVLGLVIWRSGTVALSALDEVRKELSSLQGIVDVSRDAIIGVTPDGVIMSWNSGARSIYGYTAREAMGSQISMLFDLRRGQEANALFDKVSRGENVQQHEMVHLKKGRTPIDVSLTICPIHDAGQITGASVVARDITERKRAAGSLAQ